MERIPRKQFLLYVLQFVLTAAFLVFVVMNLLLPTLNLINFVYITKGVDAMSAAYSVFYNPVRDICYLVVQIVMVLCSVMYLPVPPFLFMSKWLSAKLKYFRRWYWIVVAVLLYLIHAWHLSTQVIAY